MNTFTLERNNYRRKLITLVKQHPILWNKTQENYNRNRPQKIQAWQEISEKLDITVDKLRRTWENLRDQYRRDLKREVRYGFKSKWRFFSDMDFIRDMVSCKENGFKEAEFTDSDSELDVTDNTLTKTQNPLQLAAPPPVHSNNITCSSNSTMTTSSCSSNYLTFQPIVLTKQWQHLDAAICSTQHAASTTAAVELTSNCDSSKDPNQMPPSSLPPPSTHQLAYETVTKQEPDLDLELDRAAEVVLQVQESASTSLNILENQNNREFQESCVSTSTTKRARTSTEDISDSTSTQAVDVRNVQVKTDPDFNTKDDDYYFVMSLLPSLRQIPRNRKFPLRIAIMSLIAKELEEVCKE